MAAALSDVNADGKADIAVANSISNSVSIFWANSDGTFQPRLDYTTATVPMSVAFGDLNLDNRPDLVVASYSGSIGLWLGDGVGGFTPLPAYVTTGVNPAAVAVGDLNRDTRPDLAYATASNAVNVAFGYGDGTFSVSTVYSIGADPVSIAIGDLNGDGYPDLVTANYTAGTVSILRGNSTVPGTFGSQVNYTIGNGSGPGSVAIGDVNGDARLDLVVANYTVSTVSVLLAQLDGTFSTGGMSYAVGTNPEWIVTTDFNRDGLADVATANAGSRSVTALLGQANGTLGSPAHYTVSGIPYSLVAGTLDGDMLPDLAVVSGDLANGGDVITTLLNTCQ